MSSDELYVNLVLLSFLIVSFLLNLKFNQINKMLNDELRLQRIIVKEHEAQQMKEPFYQLDEAEKGYFDHSMKIYDRFRVEGDSHREAFYRVVMLIKNMRTLHAFTTWAIEQEKLEEEEAE